MALVFTYLDGVITDSPGASLDKELYEEFKSNFQKLVGALGETGTGTFAGRTGVLVTFGDMGGVDYHISVTPKGPPSGRIGDISFDPLSATSARIYCSGGSTQNFSFWVGKNIP